MAAIKMVETLPEDIVDHPHLRDATKLDLSHCTKLVALPERFGQLTNLTTLRLPAMLADKESTYATLSKSSTLTSLDLRSTSIRSLPKGILYSNMLEFIEHCTIGVSSFY